LANPPPKIRWAVFFAIALLALAVRLPQLGERPMHTDESVNAYITGELLAGESFHYDPQDRHGPLLFAVAEPVAKLSGAKKFSELTETELRLTPVIAGSAMILLFGAGVEMFGFIACVFAALLFAAGLLRTLFHPRNPVRHRDARLDFVRPGGIAKKNALVRRARRRLRRADACMQGNGGHPLLRHCHCARRRPFWNASLPTELCRPGNRRCKWKNHFHRAGGFYFYRRFAVHLVRPELVRPG
jgi:hypothetical protein